MAIVWGCGIGMLISEIKKPIMLFAEFRPHSIQAAEAGFSEFADSIFAAFAFEKKCFGTIFEFPN
jgi:hypothetical protein